MRKGSEPAQAAKVEWLLAARTWCPLRASPTRVEQIEEKNLPVFRPFFGSQHKLCQTLHYRERVRRYRVSQSLFLELEYEKNVCYVAVKLATRNRSWRVSNTREISRKI